MTELELEKAIDIKNNIDKNRHRKEELEKQQSLCWGKISEVRARSFCASIVNINGSVSNVSIEPESAKLALDREIKIINEVIKNLLDDLSAL